MNQDQFAIVKAFQKMGVEYKRLADAFKESRHKIFVAYQAPNYREYRRTAFSELVGL